MWEHLIAGELTLHTTLFRLILSFLAGGLIGAEREGHTSPAGFRTHILICTGSTLLMILSISVADNGGDPARIAAQVVSGIGFLGAGAIMRFGTTVQGLTSAASIWAVAALGLTIGAGQLPAAGIFIVILLFSLIILDRIEKRLFTQRELKIVHIWIRGAEFNIEPYRAILNQSGAVLKNMEISYSRNKDVSMFRILARFPTSMNLSTLAANLSAREEILKFKLDQQISATSP